MSASDVGSWELEVTASNLLPMTVIDAYHFAVAPDEEVTVTALESDTAFSIGWALNQAHGPMIDGAPFTFKVTRNPTYLVLTGVFSDDEGGRYEITFEGSAGGRSIDVLEQTGNAKVDIHEYEFRTGGGL